MRVWLPPEAPRAILYLNDGQNLFRDHRSRRPKWRADEAAARSMALGRIPPLAIVGIDHGGGRRRWRDYLPYADPRNALARDFRADRFADFVVGRVMRDVPRLHPELALAEHVGFGGSSYGAVVAIHAARRSPGVFDRLLLESPVLWVGDGRSMEEALELEVERVFIGMGTRESRLKERSEELVGLARELARGLRRRTRVRLVVGEGSAHHESAWAERFPGALRWLFPRSGR